MERYLYLLYWKHAGHIRSDSLANNYCNQSPENANQWKVIYTGFNTITHVPGENMNNSRPGQEELKRLVGTAHSA